MSGDAFHMTSPPEDGDGARALDGSRDRRREGQSPTRSATSTRTRTSTGVGDIAEVNAIKSCFGDYAKKLPVSSTKSMTGHLLGAAGGVEAIFSVLAMRDGVIPPTINLDNPGEGCDLDFVPHTARDAKLDVVLSNSFGFGGTNGTLVFRSALTARGPTAASPHERPTCASCPDVATCSPLAADFPQRYPALLESVARGAARTRYDILFAFPDDEIRLDRDGVRS